MKAKSIAHPLNSEILAVVVVLSLMCPSLYAIHQGGTADGHLLPYSQRMSHPLDEPVNAALGGRAFMMNLGPTGIRADIRPDYPKEFKVKFVFKDDYSPAKGLIKPGDHIVGANGKLFQNPHRFHRKQGGRGWPGPPFELALAIEDSQGRDGKLQLMVKKGGSGSPVVVTLQLEAVGRFSDTWPWNCKRSDRLLKDLLDFMLDGGNISRMRRHHYIQALLAVWASGDERAMSLVRAKAGGLMKSRPSFKSGGMGPTWMTGYNGILLGEYYNATKDEGVKVAAKNFAPFYEHAQFENGSYGHRSAISFIATGRKPYASMAAAGGICMLAQSTFKANGLAYSEVAYQRGHLGHLRSAGRDGGAGIAYGFAGVREGERPTDHAVLVLASTSGIKEPTPRTWWPELGGKNLPIEGGLAACGTYTVEWPHPKDHRWRDGCIDWLKNEKSTVVVNWGGPGQKKVTAWRHLPDKVIREPTGPYRTTPNGAGHQAGSAPGALAHFIGNEDNKPWNWLGKHMATGCALSPKMLWDGHADAVMHSFFGALAAFRADEKSLRSWLDYTKTWIILSETHEPRAKGGLVDQPFGCQRNGTASIARGRTAYTHVAIAILSVPKRHLLLTGAGASIPGASKLSLSGPALTAYNLIEKGNMAKALLTLTPLKKNATGTMLNQLEAMEKYALAPVLSDLENLETLHGQRDMYKLDNELNAKDKKYKSIPAYDDKVSTYRQTLAQPENQRLVKVGGAFYKLVDHWESPSGRSEKKGKKLETLKRFVGNYKDTPYGPIALNYAREPFTEFATVVNELASMHRKNDVYGARRKLAAADPHYSMYSTYVEKTAPIKAWLNSPESRELLAVGTEYYKIVDSRRRSQAPRKGQTLQELKDFVAANGKTSYGPVAMDYARTMIVEMNGKLMEVDRLIGPDPYRAYGTLAALNREYGMYSTYLQKRESIKAKLDKPETRKLIQVGSAYYKLTKTIVRSAGLNKGGNLDSMQRFVNSYGDTPYGAMARESHAEMVTELEEAVGAIQKLLDLGDPFKASLEISKTNRQYGSSKVYTAKLAPITEALQTPENRKMKAVGATYYRLVGEAEKRPGNSTKKKVQQFAGTYKGSFYGQMAKDLASSM